MNKLLTISIPTYNRRRFAERQIRILAEKILSYRDKISLIVVNNCSDDDTELCLNSLQSIYDFKYFCNDRNLGLVGNCARCIDLAESSFLWIVGDDDNLDQLDMSELLDALVVADVTTNLIQFNCALVDGRDDSVISPDYYGTSYKSSYSNVEFVALNKQKGYSISMWIAGNIARLSSLKQARSHWDDTELLALPLYWFLFAGLTSSQVTVLPVGSITMVCNTTSWASKFASRIVVLDVPLIQQRLIDHPLNSIKETFLPIVKRQPLLSRMWYEVMIARKQQGWADMYKAIKTGILNPFQIPFIFLLGPIALLARQIANKNGDRLCKRRIRLGH